MIQCCECEFFHEGPEGQIAFSCSPFHTIKEPECIAKWQLIKLDTVVQSHQATLKLYERLAPLQEKMFRHMERELEEQEEAERWKYSEEAEEEDAEDDADEDKPGPPY